MSNNFEIKICGINDKLCMDAAIESKADYIGLVFYDKSPRNLSLGDAQQLLKNRNQHSKIVALTVNSDDDFIKDIKQNIKPDYFQLHGNETPLRCKEIKVKFDIPIIKGIGIKNKLDLIKANQDYKNLCDILLLDSPSSILPGGNGEKFNWNIIKFRVTMRVPRASEISRENLLLKLYHFAT